MEKIMDTLAQMVAGKEWKEWNDESDGLFALSGSIDDGLIQATLKGTPKALVSVIGQGFPDDVSYEEMIECLWANLKIAQEQIKSVYNLVM